MEILQTIWNAIANENELILNIISVPMTFIEVTLTLLLFTKILNISFSKKQGILYVVSFSTVAIISTYLIPSPYNVFINVSAFPIIVYFTLKTNAFKAILSEIVFYTLFSIIATPLIAIYSAISGMSSIAISVIPIHKVCYSILLYIVMFLIYKILNRYNLKITFFDKFDTFGHNTLIINLIAGIVAITLQIYIEFMYIDYLPIELIITSILVLLVYFCISLYTLFRTSKLEQTKQLLETEKIYNQTLNTLHDNIRGFKHDFNNIVQAIGGYISANNMEGLKTYYRDLLEECQINNNLAVLNPEIINNPAIYSLLADKYYKAEKYNIKLNLEIFADLSNLNIKSYELTRILGILLDNAIEAASKCENKIVNVTFRKDKNRTKLLIIIQNTYINKDVNVDKIFDKGYTTKTDDTPSQNHGLGLWEVRNYLKKNTNLDLYTTKTQELFSQQFEIYN